jgi:Tol biopolymer transport system component
MGRTIAPFRSGSHDGRWIYFSSGAAGSQIWKISPEGGERVLVSKNGGMAPMEGRDGRTLYYYRDRAIWRSDLNGENERRLIDALDFQDWKLCANQLCLLQKASNESAMLVRYDPATERKQSKLLDIGPSFGASRGMDVSPDGKWVVYTRADSIESDLMLVENFH